MDKVYTNGNECVFHRYQEFCNIKYKIKLKSMSKETRELLIENKIIFNYYLQDRGISFIHNKIENKYISKSNEVYKLSEEVFKTNNISLFKDNRNFKFNFEGVNEDIIYKFIRVTYEDNENIISFYDPPTYNVNEVKTVFKTDDLLENECYICLNKFSEVDETKLMKNTCCNVYACNCCYINIINKNKCSCCRSILF